MEPGRLELSVDGQLAARQPLPADPLGHWDQSYRFALGNELTYDRPWLGEIRRAVVRTGNIEVDYARSPELETPENFWLLWSTPRLIPLYDRYWCGARDQGDVWFVDKPARNDLHPTMKPVALVERAVRNSSKTRDIVLDPFAGSGSTLIACAKVGRQARLIELDPRYCDVIVRRFQDWTGEVAVLEGTGRTTKRSPPGARPSQRAAEG